MGVGIKERWIPFNILYLLLLGLGNDGRSFSSLFEQQSFEDGSQAWKWQKKKNRYESWMPSLLCENYTRYVYVCVPVWVCDYVRIHVYMCDYVCIHVCMCACARYCN